MICWFTKRGKAAMSVLLLDFISVAFNSTISFVFFFSKDIEFVNELVMILILTRDVMHRILLSVDFVDPL